MSPCLSDSMSQVILRKYIYLYNLHLKGVFVLVCNILETKLLKLHVRPLVSKMVPTHLSLLDCTGA